MAKNLKNFCSLNMRKTNFVILNKETVDGNMKIIVLLARK